MDFINALILGALQGITEFLPVSSTGHLILARSLFGIEEGYGLAFDAILHLATAAAVVVYFFDEIYVLAQTLFRKLGRLPVNETDYTLLKALAIGTIPAVIFGLMLEDTMEHFFREPLLVAGVLVAGSLLFMYAEYYYENCYHHREVDVKTGFKIGLFQVLALIPGMSRSGATIAGGMLMGLSRSDAARFAFLLAVPIIFGAGIKKLFELMMSDTTVTWLPIILGAITAFVTGLFAIHFMISFVRKHTLWPFIWYRIILAAFVVFVWFFG